MIKGILKSVEGKKDVLFLGISEQNVQALKRGEPIFIKDFADLPVDIVIHYGHTEQKIEDELMNAMGTLKRPILKLVR